MRPDLFGPFDQAHGNEVVSRSNDKPEGMLRARDAIIDGVRIHEVISEGINRVAQEQAGVPSEVRARSYEMKFAVARNSHGYLYTMTCWVALPASQGELDEVEAFLASIRFPITKEHP